MSTSRSSWPASSASWSRTSSSPCGRCQELREERALSRHDSPKRGRCELAGAILVIDALEQAEQEAPVSHLEHAQKGWKLRVVPRLGGWRGGLYWFSRILVKGEEGGGFGSSLRESGGGGEEQGYCVRLRAVAPYPEGSGAEAKGDMCMNGWSSPERIRR
jgi:hypothetical protein